MAKLYGLNGLIRGRQGNNVYSVQNGTQVLKVYNPVVYNPRTLSQREQRVKFALAGKMSGATPSEALVGLVGASNRARRAAFVRLLTNAASVTGTIDNLVATVPYDEVIYSEGAVAMYSVVPTVTAAAQGTSTTMRISVNVSGMAVSSYTPANYGELVVVALYDAADSSLEEVQVQERTLNVTNQFLFRQGKQRDCRVCAYIVPFIEQNTVSRPRTGAIADSETAVTLTAQSVYRLTSAEFGRSVFLGVYPVITSSQSHAVAPDDDSNRSAKKK